jgi:hypothetical protein
VRESSKLPKEKELVCGLCYGCQNDCKRTDLISNCINFKQGYSSKEYKIMLRESNTNIRKQCDKYGISSTIMNRMLDGRQHWTYKYRMILNDILFETEEMQKYIDRFDEVANG